MKRARSSAFLVVLVCAACERQDFTGPLIVVADAEPEASVEDAAPDVALDAGPDAADAADAAVEAASPLPPLSCKDALMRDPAAKSGVYTIDTDGAGARAPFTVRCDMATNGGGWTLIARSVPGDAGDAGDAGAAAPFGWTRAVGDVATTNAPYSLAPRAQGVTFDAVLVGARDVLRGPFDWLYVYELPVDAAFIDAHTGTSTSIAPRTVQGCGPGVPSFLRHAGYTEREGSFFLRDSDDALGTSGLTPSGFTFAGVAPGDGIGCATYGGLYGAQGMIMVR